MKTIARCLVVVAVAGHVGLLAADAFAMSAGGSDFARARAGWVQLAQSTGGAGGGTGGEGGGGGPSGSGAGPGPGTGPGPGPGPGPGGHGGGNPAQMFGAAPAVSGACGVDFRLPDASAYANALDGLAAVSHATQDYLERCGCATQACVADALDKYAVELKKIAPRLPRGLRKLPQTVAAAAQKVRAAPSLPAAVRVAKAAVAVVQTVVHKAIALMRAADPDAVGAVSRGGDLVAHTLDAAAKALERAETL